MNINYLLGTVLITYNTNILYEKKVLCWIKKAIGICIDNTKLFKQYFDSNPQYVITTIEQQFKDAIKEI